MVCPEQIVSVPLTVKVGKAFTVIVLVLLAVQPPELVPVTVYTVVVVGLRATAAVVAPVLHV